MEGQAYRFGRLDGYHTHSHSILGITKGYWRDAEHRKQFWLHFAKEHNFDPTNADAWLGVDRASILAMVMLPKYI